jgi:hypothetical protein
MKTLADPLPLRTSDEWIGRRESVPLAVRVGHTRGRLTQYNQARTQFVWAGHACAGVDQVYVGGLPVDGWQQGNVIDSAGKLVSMVTFAAPQAEGADLTASGRGLLDDATGQLVENPADALFAIWSASAAWRSPGNSSHPSAPNAPTPRWSSVDQSRRPTRGRPSPGRSASPSALSSRQRPAQWPSCGHPSARRQRASRSGTATRLSSASPTWPTFATT